MFLEQVRVSALVAGQVQEKGVKRLRDGSS